MDRIEDLKGISQGRYKIPQEEKAQAIPLKLHTEHREKLKFVPGKTNAEKVRFLLDNYTSLIQRERRQIEEIKKRVEVSAHLARKLYDPKMREDFEQLKKINTAFDESYENLKSLFNLFHFGIKEVKEFLCSSEKVDLDIIFFMKSRRESEQY